MNIKALQMGRQLRCGGSAIRPDICDGFSNLALCPFIPIRLPKALTVPALVLEVKLRFKKRQARAECNLSKKK
jgi:hypothetical protein